MNWYFEKDGISQGPLSEETLVAKVRAATELNADSLIWHTGLEDWQALRTLRPDWLASTASATASTKPNTPAPKAPAKVSAPPRKATPQPIAEPPAPIIATVPAPAPAPAPAAKPGLLKRLFGFGRSK